MTGGALRILSQPPNLTVSEGANFNLTVDVAGGASPYSYQWYKDGAAIARGLGTSYFYADQANRYSKEGSYYLVIKDAAGAILQSNSARVGIVESQGPCDATQYMMFNNPGADSGLDMLGLFDNSHGKFLINKNNTDVSWMNATPSQLGITYFSFNPALQDGQTATIACTTTIARIHTPTPNPSTASTNFTDSTNSAIVNASGTYDFQGSVNFVCHNQKYKFVSDTCVWVKR